MKQSFEVFEQSDGVALHLTVTVDSDSFARGECRNEIELLTYSGSTARAAAELAIAPELKKLPDAVRSAIQHAANKRFDNLSEGLRQIGARDRQPEVDALNADILALRTNIAEHQKENNEPAEQIASMSAELSKAKRATRKATRK
jgi:hypothetical protein